MVKILQVDGIRYAADVMTGQQPFPSFNKIDPLQKEEDSDFAQVFKKACAEVSLRTKRGVPS